MKKTLWILLSLALGLTVLFSFLWIKRASVTAELIHRHLGVPVAINSLEVKNPGVVITTFSVGNPRGFDSKSAFTAGEVEISTSWAKLRGNPLIIDEIDMSDLLLTIETNGEKTNWDQILSTKKKKSTPSERHWLIRKLVVRNLNVQVITNGDTKAYPPLEYMEFNNISDESGFPIDEIEKAIFNKLMNHLFQQLNLPKQLLQPFLPGGGNSILPIPKFW